MEVSNKIVLEPKYYHDNFCYLLKFVQDKYKSILNESEWRFLRKFYCLSEDSQCLFIRFTNRKGLFFDPKSLKYPEIDNISNAISELIKHGFISYLNEEHQPYLLELMEFLKKDEFLKFANTEEKKIWQKLKKEELIQSILLSSKAKEWISFFKEQNQIIKLNFEIETNFIKFLFFGNRYSDMSEFVMRDLGIMQFEKYDDDKLIARFANRKEAEDKWIVSIHREYFDNFKTKLLPKEVNDWFLTTIDSLQDISEIAKPSLERFKLKIASFLEKNKENELALGIYKITEEVPARERSVRILLKLKLIDEAKSLLNFMIDNPKNADEHFFAIDNLNKLNSSNKKSKKSTTEKLSNARSITITKDFKSQVELGTIDYYIQKGYEGTFTENHLWRAIFGLTFWDIIFDTSLVSFHHPLQQRPSDLYLPDFYEKRKTLIHAQLDSFENTAEFIVFLAKKFNDKQGIANPFVLWLDEIWLIVRKAAERIELEKLKLVLIEIAKNIIENSRGFPDIMIWNETDIEFIEVKSPSDSLSNQQLFWLDFFEKINLKSSVLRVYFE